MLIIKGQYTTLLSVCNGLNGQMYNKCAFFKHGFVNTVILNEAAF